MAPQFDYQSNVRALKRNRDRSTDPILWPAGASLSSAQPANSPKDNVNFNAIGFLLREK